MAFKKGYTPWNKGIPKEQNHWFGKKHTEESKRKQRIAKLGKPSNGPKGNGGVKWSEESKKNFSKLCKETDIRRGTHSSFWKGGICNNPYSVDWTRSLKISIRERDKYTCRICGVKQGDKAHHVHHIDYNKKNCNPDNLITLCCKCHINTNFNRKYWEKHFIN